MEEKIDLPEKGIVVGFELENLEDYLNCTEHLVQVHGKFEVLAEIEKKVKYEKIRHLAKFLMTEYNPELKGMWFLGCLSLKNVMNTTARRFI